MSQSQPLISEREITWFWEDMDAEVRGTLTPAQRVAIENAVKKTSSYGDPADLRLHFGGYFVRILAGKERRNPERLKQDRKNNPIFSGKNAAVIAVFWIMTLRSTLYIGAFALNIIGGYLLR